MTEFELIESIIQQLEVFSQSQNVAIGPGDDAAVIDVPKGEQLVVSTDTLLPNLHFPAAASAELIGYRSLAVSASDLAAMAANPLAATVALTLDEVNPDWVQSFIHGLGIASCEYGLPIVGGNLARGNLSITVNVQGSVPENKARTRTRSAIGDDIWLTGTLGATIRYLAKPTLLTSSIETILPDRDRDHYARYFLPHARISFGQKIRDYIHACIDVSDGLVSELHHLCEDNRGMRVDVGKLPVWSELSTSDVLGADDSYELLFTAPPSSRDRILALAHSQSTPVVVIGEVIDQKVVSLWLDGEEIESADGFDHFR